MAISLSKGGTVSLAKAADDAGVKLTKLTAELSWHKAEDTTTESTYDLDLSAFGLRAGTPDNETGKVISDAWFVFFNNLNSPDGSLRHHGDLLVGGVEKIDIDLDRIPSDCDHVDVTATISGAVRKKQNFGGVTDGWLRLRDAATGVVLVEYDLSEDFSVETAIVGFRIYRRNGNWQSRAVGKGYKNGLTGLAGDRGVNVGNDEDR